MVEAKKNKSAYALWEAKSACKEFVFTTELVKGSLAKGHVEN